MFPDSLAYAFVCHLPGILMVGSRPNVRLRAEVLALRHQLRVLKRQFGRAPGGSPLIASCWPPSAAPCPG